MQIENNEITPESEICVDPYDEEGIWENTLEYIIPKLYEYSSCRSLPIEKIEREQYYDEHMIIRNIKETIIQVAHRFERVYSKTHQLSKTCRNYFEETYKDFKVAWEICNTLGFEIIPKEEAASAFFTESEYSKILNDIFKLCNDHTFNIISEDDNKLKSFKGIVNIVDINNSDKISFINGRGISAYTFLHALWALNERVSNFLFYWGLSNAQIQCDFDYIHLGEWNKKVSKSLSWNNYTRQLKWKKINYRTVPNNLSYYSDLKQLQIDEFNKAVSIGHEKLTKREPLWNILKDPERLDSLDANSLFDEYYCRCYIATLSDNRDEQLKELYAYAEMENQFILSNTYSIFKQYCESYMISPTNLRNKYENLLVKFEDVDRINDNVDYVFYDKLSTIPPFINNSILECIQNYSDFDWDNYRIYSYYNLLQCELDCFNYVKEKLNQIVNVNCRIVTILKDSILSNDLTNNQPVILKPTSNHYPKLISDLLSEGFIHHKGNKLICKKPLTKLVKWLITRTKISYNQSQSSILYAYFGNRIKEICITNYDEQPFRSWLISRIDWDKIKELFDYTYDTDEKKITSDTLKHVIMHNIDKFGRIDLLIDIMYNTKRE